MVVIKVGLALLVICVVECDCTIKQVLDIEGCYAQMIRVLPRDNVGLIVGLRHAASLGEVTTGLAIGFPRRTVPKLCTVLLIRLSDCVRVAASPRAPIFSAVLITDSLYGLNCGCRTSWSARRVLKELIRHVLGWPDAA